MLHCHHHSNSHIKIGSGVSHCNVSFTVKGQNRNSTMSKPQQKPRTERITFFYLNWTVGFVLGNFEAHWWSICSIKHGEKVWFCWKVWAKLNQALSLVSQIYILHTEICTYIIITMYIYHALINALGTHMIHINLNTSCTLLPGKLKSSP